MAPPSAISWMWRLDRLRWRFRSSAASMTSSLRVASVIDSSLECRAGLCVGVSPCRCGFAPRAAASVNRRSTPHCMRSPALGRFLSVVSAGQSRLPPPTNRSRRPMTGSCGPDAPEPRRETHASNPRVLESTAFRRRRRAEATPWRRPTRECQTEAALLRFFACA